MRTHVASAPGPTTRRQFLAGAAGLAATALWPVRLGAAASPYAFRHGDFDITIVSDGSVMPPSMMLQSDAPSAELEAAFKAAGQTPGKVELSANVTLIRSADDLILVDTGSGTGVGPTAGKLLENLAAAGVAPSSVTKVVFSHAHPDHIWGTIGNADSLHFPNASYFVAPGEWDFWMAPDLVSKFPKDFQGVVTEAQRNLTRVKDRLTMLKPGDDVVTGVNVLDTAGHTPGHISLEVAGGDGLIVVADALIFSTISFEQPDWHFAMDTVQDLAGTNRKKLLERAVVDKSRLIGFHWPYPGVGHAERKDQAFRFVPAES